MKIPIVPTCSSEYSLECNKDNVLMRARGLNLFFWSHHVTKFLKFKLLLIIFLTCKITQNLYKLFFYLKPTIL